MGLFSGCLPGQTASVTPAGSSTVTVTEEERKKAELINGRRKLSLKYPSLVSEGIAFEGEHNLIPTKNALMEKPMGDVWKGGC